MAEGDGRQKSVTKKEIVRTICGKVGGVTQMKTKAIVQETFNAIVDALVAGKRVELRNFGVFDLRVRAARRARNPKTGDPVDVPAKLIVTFKPGKEMEERVQEREAFLLEVIEGKPAGDAEAVPDLE